MDHSTNIADKSAAEKKTWIRTLLQEEGFDAVGFAAPSALADAQGFAKADLRAFLDAGHHGDMAWLEDRWEMRADPRALWPEVGTVIAVAANYAPPDPLDQAAKLAARDTAVISVYAGNRDYHDTLKKALKRAGRRIHRELQSELKVFIDTAPVMEKPLAAAAGIGWQGKHTNLVSRTHGSWLFLGALYLADALPPDTPHDDLCGSCTACLDACPTKAFPEPGKIDARRCISYLTIEAKTPTPKDLRANLGNRIYGCDDCLAACPWNKFSEPTTINDFLPRTDLAAPKLADLAGLDDPSFRTLFSGSPVKRIKRDRFLHNVLIAIGNSADPSLLPSAIDNLEDPSPLVRTAATWAVRQLADEDAFFKLKAKYEPLEQDPDVRAEWA